MIAQFPDHCLLLPLLLFFSFSFVNDIILSSVETSEYLYGRE